MLNYSCIKFFFSLLAMALLLTGCYRTIRDLEEQRQEHAFEDETYLYAGLDPNQTLRLSVNDAIDIALERNLDLAVKAQELNIQQETYRRQVLNELPKLIADGEYSYRNRNLGAFSESLIPGVPPAPLSIGAQQHTKRWNIMLTWNLVDFGVSYFRSNEESNKVLVQQFEYERIAQNLILEVVKAYWKAVGEKHSLDVGRQLNDTYQTVKDKLQVYVGKRFISPKKGSALLAQLAFAEVRFAENQVEYDRAMEDLKKKIGIPPDILVELTENVPDYADEVPLPCVDSLEQTALFNRPELYTKEVQEAVWKNEVWVAIVQMFPEIAPFISDNNDLNFFLLYHHWMTLGLRATWNLLGFASKIQDTNIAKAQIELTRINRLLQSISVLSQVHMAYIVYLDNLDRFRVLKELLQFRQDVLKVAAKEMSLDAISDSDYVLASIELYIAEIEASRAFAELQGSLEQINNSIGIPLYYGDVDLDQECCSQEV